jgi:hypothetical protein
MGAIRFKKQSVKITCELLDVGLTLKPWDDYNIIKERHPNN